MNQVKHILLLMACCVALLSSCGKHSHEQVVGWYEQGKALRASGEPAEAMKVFLKAAHSTATDEALLGRVYSNMANICRQANDHQTAYHVYKLSAEHFSASGDGLAYAYALNNMAWEQAAMAHKDSALALVDAALQVYPLCPLTDKVVETHAAACYFVQEYDSVLFYTSPPSNEYLMMLRAQAYSFLQEDDSAAYYARILLPLTDNPFYLDDLYYILTHNDAQADAETIRDLSSERADVQRTIAARHGKLMQAVQILRDDLSPRSTNWRNLVEIILIGLICLAMIVAGVLTIHERRQLLHDRQEQEQARQEDLEQSLNVLRTADDLRLELQWNDNLAFFRRTDKLFRGLATTLEQQGLNEQDVRMCVLVLIGLSHKEIAAMMPCSIKSIGKLKDLTARKLGVPGGRLRIKLTEIVVGK